MATFFAKKQKGRKKTKTLLFLWIQLIIPHVFIIYYVLNTVKIRAVRLERNTQFLENRVAYDCILEARFCPMRSTKYN